MKLKQDRYKKRRGGNSRLLELKCAQCSHHLFYYQKDGPGIIKRLYLDRIYPSASRVKNLVCPKCGEVLGTQMIYKKEGRLAYRIFSGALSKKIVSANLIK